MAGGTDVPTPLAERLLGTSEPTGAPDTAERQVVLDLRSWRVTALAATAGAAVLLLAGLCLVSYQQSPLRLATHVTSLRGLPFLAEANQATLGYKPVVLYHGIELGASELGKLTAWIADAHPGTEVYRLQVLDGALSLSPLAVQVDFVAGALRELTRQHPASFANGYHLVCHSQGAVVCRSLCEMMDDHHVHSLVSLAGPQLGVFGEVWGEYAASAFSPFAPGLPGIPGMEPVLGAAYTDFYLLAYTPVLQRSLSVANLWHDPLHEGEYLEGNLFLPVVNGQGPHVSDRDRASLRANFLRLQKAVFLTGSFANRSYDSPLGVEPWQSAIFGYYADGSQSEIVPMERQPLFVHDTFGLRTLSETGRLWLEAVEAVPHWAWVKDRAVFERYVLPHLT